MDTSVAVLFARFRDRIEAKGARHGLVYPWWIPVLSSAGLVGGAAIGAAQRYSVDPSALLVVAAALTVLPCLAHFVIRPWLPWWVEVVVVLVGVAWLLTYPLPDERTIDLAPVALVFAVGEVTATEGVRRGLVAVAASVTLLFAVGDHPPELSWLFAGEVLVGLVFGYMLRWQMRALAAEHLARDEEAERATLAERQRVAGEIHDLVAHSLSVTMLHVTGARRALTEDADVADAVEALTEAERIGRQAMADIRRTVGVLRTETGDVRPLPDAGDLDRLVADVRAAGLQVEWTREGEVDGLPPAAGLGLYRIVQESLANVAKHALGAPATVTLVVDDATARLTVSNPVLEDAVVGTGGSGLAGMTSRVGQLGGRLDAGRDGDRWRVDLVLPLVDEPPGHDCVVSRLLT